MHRVSRSKVASAERERRRRSRQLTLPAEVVIPGDMTFVEWCEVLAEEGLLVDGIPFSLADRPAMRWLYEQVPSTVEEAHKQYMILQKCSQVGFTVMEMLATIYWGLKFEPIKIGMYLPDQKLAAAKSTERFLPVVRTVPVAYKRLTRGKASEGNVMIRNIGNSRYHFLWTSGKSMTESFPIDILSFDEVQEMTIESMEKTGERLSASNVRFTMMGSTANYPDSDINWWYKRGTRHRFHTECPECGERHIMDEYFPDKVGEIIRMDTDLGDYRYACPHCDGWIDDTQTGEWIPEDPESRRFSAHFHQMLSPTISPREIIEAFYNGHDRSNFYKRKLGKPYVDPTEMPVNMDVLNQCATDGMAAGLVWRNSGKGAFMGIDNMGGFSCVLIAERLDDGRMAIRHVEAIYGLDPWARLSELMVDFRVSVCVSEQLPNYDSAKQFAQKWLGRVFLVSSYLKIEDDMLRWGDAVVSRADRRTSEEARDRYTLSVDQYKLMSWSFARLTNRSTIFPDPTGLVQEISEKGRMEPRPILRDMVFDHFCHTALVTEKDEEEHKIRRKVIKVGLDPHFSFSYMLCCAAWCRAHGTTQFFIPSIGGDDGKSEVRKSVEESMPGLPNNVVHMMESAVKEGTCGSCTSFSEGSCQQRGFQVSAADPGCDFYIRDDFSTEE
jgi:hypothetical protein